MQSSRNSIQIVRSYEKRIDNCFSIIEHLEEGTWAHTYWTNTAAALLRRTNCYLNGGSEHTQEFSEFCS